MATNYVLNLKKILTDPALAESIFNKFCSNENLANLIKISELDLKDKNEYNKYKDAFDDFLNQSKFVSGG